MPATPSKISNLGKVTMDVAKKIAPYAAVSGAGIIGGVSGYHLGKAVEKQNDKTEDQYIAEQFYNLGERNSLMKTSELVNTVYEQAFAEEFEKLGGGKAGKGVLSFARPILEKLRIMRPEQTRFEKVMNKAKDIGETVMGATKGGAKKAWSATKGGAEKAWGATQSGAEKAWEASRGGAEKAWEASRASAEHAWKATKNFGGELGAEYVAAGKGIATTPTKSFGLAGQHLLNVIKTNPKAAIATGIGATGLGATGIAIGTRKRD